MIEPSRLLEAALLEAATEAGTGLTPAAFKSLSKSVADLSTLTPPDLMKSTGDLMTGKVFKRKMKQLKSGSQQSLIPGSGASSVEDLTSYVSRLVGLSCRWMEVQCSGFVLLHLVTVFLRCVVVKIVKMCYHLK